FPTPERLRTTAKETFHKDGELEIDEDAKVSFDAEQACRVSCWVWVSDEAAGITDTDHMTDDQRTQAYLFGTNNIDTAAQFDDEARVSLGDDAGAYVSGW